MNKLFKTTFLTLTISTILATSSTATQKEKIWIGDPVNGQKLFEKATSRSVKRSASWINTYSDQQSLKYLKSGKKSFPKIHTENTLDLYDVLAYIRANNIELADLNIKASHFLVTGGKLDQYAIERLKERGGIDVPKSLQKKRIFVAFDLNPTTSATHELVYPKNAKKRDLLKPKKKVAYVVFLPISNAGDPIEAAYVFNPQMQLIDIQLKNKAQHVSIDSNKYLKKLLMQGARSKYNALKIPKQLKYAQKAQFDKEMSANFLIASELIYMYEVKERDYFAFDIE